MTDHQYHVIMIISASRRCDIPAFYSPWLAKRFEQEFVFVRNPFNRHQVGRVGLSPSDVDAIVFWSKNPAPMISHLDIFKSFPYYFQYTLTGYPVAYEPNLPSVEARIATFQTLAEQHGSDRLVWRYDPILISPECTLAWHRSMFSFLCERLAGCTDTCVISFLDMYRHMKPRCDFFGIREPEQTECLELAEYFVSVSARYGIEIHTCTETLDLSALGILKSSCIDGHRLERICGRPFLTRKDQYQRKGCGCIESVDIGTYDTCPHGCIYCYANPGRSDALERVGHDIDSPFLIGNQEPDDLIYDRNLRPMVASDSQCVFDF